MNWQTILALLAILTSFLVAISAIPLNHYTATLPVMALGVVVIATSPRKAA
jgi:hypothetical protein